jgi:hypothetical protein
MYLHWMVLKQLSTREILYFVHLSYEYLNMDRYAA